MNYEAMTDQEIAHHISASDEFDEEAQPGYADRLIESLRLNQVTLERRRYGYAVVFPCTGVVRLVDGIERSAKTCIIEIVYVAQAHRGTGVATTFLDELKSKYGRWPIQIVCFKKWRQNFFAKHGFVVEKTPAPEVFEMLYPGNRDTTSSH